ncbi:MAG: gamma-glutamyltransferase [Planctomycetes bacterium]|nr:gamma-glutamyltransferase [Planctomycetota bacterium]
MLRRLFLLVAFGALGTLAACVQHEPLHAVPVVGQHGMVVCTEPLAAEAGLSMLRAGGNCVDAAVATAFALAVTWPSAGNLGGGGFMVMHLADGRETALDFRETAPVAATRDMYLGPDGKPIPERSTIGHLGVATPGSVPGLCAALARYGTKPLATVLAPAIALAESGYPLSAHHVAALNGERKLLSKNAESLRIFLCAGNKLQVGQQFKQPELARTLRRLAEYGEQEFRTGETAQLIAAEMQRSAGILSAADLVNYNVHARAPLRGRYRNYDILAMPPPSSGGVALLQMLGMLEAFDLRAMDWESARARHWIIESMKRAFADRTRHLGDPDQSDIPVTQLLSPAHIAAMRDSLGERAATPSAAALPLTRERHETTHLSVVDAHGGAVAITTTLNGSFGSGVTVAGAGFLLNNEMDDFASAPGVPNMYGLVQGEANAVAPLRRPLSSMTPTVLLRDGNVVFVTGSPGGPTIISTVLLSILAFVDAGADAAAAVEAARFHHQWNPDQLSFEPATFNALQRAALEKRGHRFVASPRFQGDCHAIQRNPATGVLQGAADPRHGGRAAGW